MEFTFFGFNVSAELLVSIIGVIISTILAIYFYFKSRKFKEISYKVSIDPLITIDSQVKTQLKILYEDIPIEDLILFKITYENTGNQDVEKEDFTEPFLLTFNKETNIVDFRVTEMKPELSGMNINTHKSLIEIMPNLFKVGDLFTFNLLISNYKEYTVRDRVKNTKVKKYTTYKRTSYFITLSIISLILTVIVSTLIQLFKLGQNTTIFTIGTIASLILLLLPAIWDKDYRERMLENTRSKKK